jgi:hypothetical protein
MSEAAFDTSALDETRRPAPALPPAQQAPAAAATSSEITDASLDDDTVSSGDFVFYKGRKNVVDRIAMLNPKNMKSARSHYQEGKGYFLCHSKFELVGGQEVCSVPAPCCQQLEESKKRFAALILQYTLGPDGKLINPLSYTFKLWRISDDKFVQLRDIHKEFPLDKHDLTIRCTEEQYQKLTIQASATSILANEKFPAVYRQQIETWVRSMTPKSARSLGRKLSEAELRERLGMAVTAPAVSVTEVPVIDASALLDDM